MAEDSSTSPFGVFNFSQWPPSSASQTQSQQHQSITSSFLPFSQQQPTNHSSIPSNSTAFEANSRIPGLGGFLAPPPPLLPSEVPGQFTNSSIPPLHLPPVPSSQVSTPSIPGLGGEPSLATRRPSIEASYQPPESAPKLPEVVVETAPEAITSREEGELSDGELDEGVSESAVSIHSDNEMGNSLPKPTKEPSLSEDDGSISSYNPPSASSPEPVEQIGHTATPIKQPMTESISTVADLKTKAKGAILSLMPHNITFQNLVDEGIDEGVLRQLYEEVGIKDATLRLEVEEKPKQASSRGGRSDTSTTAQGKLTMATMDENSLLPAATGGQVQVFSPLQAPGRSPDVPVTAQIQSTALPETTGAKNAALERKDRIAQLLALKAAKTTKPQSPSNIIPEIQQPAITTTLTTKKGQAQAPPPATADAPKPAPVTEDQSGKNKKKAQTDLVRAKMEALKQQALAKAQAQKAIQQVPGATMSANAPPSSSPIPGPASSNSTPGTNGATIISGPLRSPVAGEGATTKTSQKRPLASDLFEEATPPAKRRNESHEDVKIVSDEEGEVSDVDMDLDNDSDLSEGEIDDNSEAVAQDRTQIPHVSGPRSASERQEAALSNLSSTSAPQSASVTPSKEKAQDEMWRTKSDQIALMKRRIVEMEQRRKAKQVLIDQGHSPGPGTPVPITHFHSSVATPTKQSSFSEVGSISGSSPQPGDSTGKQMTGVGGIMVPTNPAAARAEALKKRIIRRREIQAGLPLIDAEVERTKSRLAEIQREAQRLEAEIQKGLEGRQNLLRELELLGVDTESAPVERMRLPELRAVRDELVEAQKQQSSVEALATDQVADKNILNGLESTRAEGQSFQSNPDFNIEPARTIETAPVAEPEESVSEGSAMDESSASSDDEPNHANEAAGLQSSFASTAADDTMVFSPEGGASLPVSDEPSSAPEDAVQPGTTVDDGHEESDADTGSVSMSDSASESSEDYEPADPPINGSITPEHLAPRSDDVMGDDYEPIDNVSPAEHQIETISQEDPQSTVPDQENSHELTESNIMIKPQEPSERAEDLNAEPQKPKFVPYDSVLRNFRNYRFNPQFTNQVAGGYRSLTYSSKIDARKVLCTTEAKGEVCNDPTCEDQHFAQMGLPDDKILVEMSSAPGMDKEARNRYVNGLKSVIADLRSRGVKHFEQVASELAAYRRRFEAEQDPLLTLPTTTDAVQTESTVIS